MKLNSKSIGSKVAEARKKINLTQAELAKQVFVSAQAVGKWERGESMPDIATLSQLADIFGLDLNHFSGHVQVAEKETPLQTHKGGDGIGSKLKDSLGLNWNMSGDSYADADFSGLKNVKDKLSGSSFKKCKLTEADLSDVTFKGNSIIECDFEHANLRNSKFYGSEIRTSSFINASLIDAAIEASEIRNCDLSNADLSGIDVSNSELRNNTTENSIWQHASFKDTQLTEMVFSGSLEACSFTSCAFSKVTFKQASFKDCFFKYCDLKRVVFIDCKADKLSYAFLKNCKASMEGMVQGTND